MDIVPTQILAISFNGFNLEKLNLFNYVLALFRGKFSCNLNLKTLYLGVNNIMVVCERVKI